MRICVGEKETADILMNTGTAQGSALSPLLFILFINALLRLFDQSSAPRFNHLAFSDDLSLYLNSEANANKLLAKVHLFEKWIGLRIALANSFVTAVTHGRESESRASEVTRGHLAGSRMAPRAHPWDLIAMEEDNEDHLLLRQFRSNAASTNRCIKCQKDKPLDRFSLAPPSSLDCAPICISCKSQWQPSGILYNGNLLPVIPGSFPTRFLGIHGDMESDCSSQICLIFQQSASIIAFLRQQKLSARHSLSLVSMTLPSYVRFPNGVISWTRSSLRKFRLPLDECLQNGMWSLMEFSLLHHAFPDGSRRQEPSYPPGGSMRNSLEPLRVMLLRYGWSA
jgi:hypothetical protein